MFVFIDESGCPGFKLDRGSTPRFVLAMVIFPDAEAVNSAASAISEVRTSTRQKAEFKFSKCSYAVRDAFFERLVTENFSVRGIVVDKTRIYSPLLRDVTEDFYRYFVRMMLEHDNGALENARVRIDGSGDREFKQELVRYLRMQLADGKIHSVKFKNSASNDLIQLADMCTGAIARRYTDNRDHAARWHGMLRPRIRDVWTFPNEGY